VISKIGEVTLKDFGKVMSFFCKDILEDFNKDNSADVAKLEKEEIKFISKSINKKAVKLVKKKLMV